MTLETYMAYMDTSKDDIQLSHSFLELAHPLRPMAPITVLTYMIYMDASKDEI
jgi:hypothetical protein